MKYDVCKLFENEFFVSIPLVPLDGHFFFYKKIPFLRSKNSHIRYTPKQYMYQVLQVRVNVNTYNMLIFGFGAEKLR